MKEEKLRNGTEEIKQEHEDKNAAGENQSGDVIDLAEDEWRDLGEDKPLGNIYTWIDTHINRLSVLLPIVSAALLILILLIIGLSGKKMDTPKVEESYVSSTPRLEKETEEEKTEPEEMTAAQSDAGEQTTQARVNASKETENMAALIEDAEEKYQALHDMIFGESSQNGSLGCVTAATRFTDREKDSSITKKERCLYLSSMMLSFLERNTFNIQRMREWKTDSNVVNSNSCV